MTELLFHVYPSIASALPSSVIFTAFKQENDEGLQKLKENLHGS